MSVLQIEAINEGVIPPVFVFNSGQTVLVTDFFKIILVHYVVPHFICLSMANVPPIETTREEVVPHVLCVIVL